MTTEQSSDRSRTAGVLAGITIALLVLLYASVMLLRVEDASAKVLVAVWLWSLPVLAMGATLGYLASLGLSALGRRGGRQ